MQVFSLSSDRVVLRETKGNQMIRIGSVLLIASVLLASAAEARPVRVDGYIRKDGTYVAPHIRTSPNSSRFDNYSTQPNVNPYTGKSGTVDPYAPPAMPKYRTYNAPRVQTYSAPQTQPYTAPCYYNCPN